MRHLILIFLISCYSHAQVTTNKSNDKWQLLLDGKPFDIKGATFGYDNDVENYDRYFKDLKFLGVNTIRTWATGKNTPQLLDAAERYGIKVMVGIWMRHGKPGMEDDDHFNYLEDKQGMEVMYNNAIEVVKMYREHPAVLTWGIGNEVYLNMATDEEKLTYSKFLERICRAIKSLDSNHPITSVEAWTFGLEWWEKYVPSIDIYGLNSYGAGANFLAAELEKRNIDKPYIITEFGVTGEWDVNTDKSGIKLEPTDKEKYDAIAIGYKEWISNKPACLGVYVFHYSNGKDFAGVWLMTHFNSSYRPQYWAIREAYTGNMPINNVPVIETFELPDEKYKSGTWIPVQLKITDVENEKLDISFHYNHRKGSRIRRNQIKTIIQRGSLEDGFEIQLPAEDGGIKIYVYAKDTYNNLGIAWTSITVEDEVARAKKYLVPKVELPFYVYQDNTNLPYTPSGYMGNYKAMEVDLNHKKDPHSGETCIEIRHNGTGGWYGIGFVNPANDWGDILGGYDISGAKTFSFWARANFDNVYADIGFGLIGKDKPFPDTAIEKTKVNFTSKWKKYIIKTKKLDLSCIRSGLVLFSNGNGSSYKVYIDDVVFE